MNRRLQCAWWFFILSAMVACPAWAQGWPSMVMPPGAKEFRVADEAGINGVPTRIRGFESAMLRPEVVAWFERQLPPTQRVEIYPVKTVLSALQGPYLLTVVVEDAAEPLPGTVVLVTQSRFPSASERTSFERQRESWLMAMPPGTQLTSQHTSVDQGRQSLQLIFVNRLQPALNAQRVVGLLGHKGYQLAGGSDRVFQRLTAGGMDLRDGMALTFKAPQGGEAYAVLGWDAGSRQSWIVMNLIRTVEAFQ